MLTGTIGIIFSAAKRKSAKANNHKEVNMGGSTMASGETTDLAVLWEEHVKYEFETGNTEDTTLPVRTP